MIHIKYGFFLKRLIIKLIFLRLSKKEIDVIYLGSAYGNWGFPREEVGNNLNILVGGVGEDITFEIELLNFFEKHQNYLTITFYDPTIRSKNYMDSIQQAIATKQSSTSSYSEKGFQNVDVYDFRMLKKEQIIFHHQAIWTNNDGIELWPPLNQEHVSYTRIGNSNASSHFPCSDILTIFNSDKIFNILKLDVEGSEVDILIRLLEKSRRLPRIILVEFDIIRKIDMINLFKLNHLIMLFKSKNYNIFYRENKNFGFILD